MAVVITASPIFEERAEGASIQYLARRDLSGEWLLGIVDNIVELSPDLITFSEVRNYNGISFISRLVTDLEKGDEVLWKGKCEYGDFVKI